MQRQRIEYIDAMRGFTMILVVYSHVIHFCFGDSTMGFNGVFFLFRLPCFFFISGWLFETVSHRPFWAVVRHKAMVQLVPTFIFLMLLAPPPEFFHQLGTLKGGYWFTFVLFEFFVIYLISMRWCGYRWGWLAALAVSVGAFWWASWQHALQLQAAEEHPLLSALLTATGLLSVSLWRYYLFFFIGAWVRRHFHDFVHATDRPPVIAAVTAGFFAIAATAHPSSPVLEYLRFNVGGILGMVMVFTLFRLSDTWLRRCGLSRPLQYVGQHTLDIYMLHYFFLPRFLLPYGEPLRAVDSQLVEFLVAVVLALVVVALSLAVSWIIRRNRFLGHYLFGARLEK